MKQPHLLRIYNGVHSSDTRLVLETYIDLMTEEDFRFSNVEYWKDGVVGYLKGNCWVNVEVDHKVDLRLSSYTYGVIAPSPLTEKITGNDAPPIVNVKYTTIFSEETKKVKLHFYLYSI